MGVPLLTGMRNASAVLARLCSSAASAAEAARATRDERVRTEAETITEPRRTSSEMSAIVRSGYLPPGPPPISMSSRCLTASSSKFSTLGRGRDRVRGRARGRVRARARARVRVEVRARLRTRVRVTWWTGSVCGSELGLGLG